DYHGGETIMPRNLSRRQALAASAAVLAAAPAVHAFDSPPKANGQLKQSLCRWCYNRMPLEKLAEEGKKIGYQSIELLNPKEVLTVKPLGMTCAILHVGGPSNIPDCLNRVANHDKIEKAMIEGIDFAAEHELPNIICFSGNRKGM